MGHGKFQERQEKFPVESQEINKNWGPLNPWERLCSLGSGKAGNECKVA